MGYEIPMDTFALEHPWMYVFLGFLDNFESIGFMFLGYLLLFAYLFVIGKLAVSYMSKKPKKEYWSYLMILTGGFFAQGIFIFLKEIIFPMFGA